MTTQRACPTPMLFGVLIVLTTLLHAAEPPSPAVPVRVAFRDGTVLHGLWQPGTLQWQSEGEPPQELKLADFVSLQLGPARDSTREAEAAKSVEALKSENFKERAAATAKLRELGVHAGKALRAAVTNPDPEVAQLARNLLAELPVDAASDVLQRADGSTQRGELAVNEARTRTRLGLLRCDRSILSALTRLPNDSVDKTVLPPADAPITPLRATDLSAPAATLKSLKVPDELPQNLRLLQMAQRPRSPDEAPAGLGAPQATDVREGEVLDTAFAPWGLLLASIQPGQNVQALQRAGGTMEARTVASDIDLRFIRPGSYKKADDTGETAAATVIVVNARSSHSGLTMHVYNAQDREIGKLSCTAEEALDDGHTFAFSASVPVTRVRLARTEPRDADELFISHIAFDRVIAPDRPLGITAAVLRTGERLRGKLVDSLENTLKLSLSLLPETAAPVEFPLDDLARIEFPFGTSTEAAQARRRSLSARILLQNGQTLPAALQKLDRKELTLALPGGALFALPRAMVRKIVIQPRDAEPGQEAAVTVGPEDKPGVELKLKVKKSAAAQPAQPAPDPKVKGPPPSADRMQVEVIGFDIETAELTVKDEFGEWTMGLPEAHALILPENQEAKAPAKLRDWRLTLRDGSQFEVTLLQIAEKGLTVDLAGAQVVLPNSVLDFAERHTKKP